jgi:hypothetical protein
MKVENLLWDMIEEVKTNNGRIEKDKVKDYAKKISSFFVSRCPRCKGELKTTTQVCDKCDATFESD